MDDLLELIIKDETNIHHKQLEFGILKMKIFRVRDIAGSAPGC
jgi:hypothetical protein